MSFKGKVALVTGASSGIGAATVIAFAAEGALVAMVGRNQTKLNNVAAKCEQKGSKPLVIIADVSKTEDNKRVMSDTLARFGKLDILVNNAGIYRIADCFAPNALDIFDEVIANNLRSAVQLTYLAAPHLVETKGNIINVSSLGSRRIAIHGSVSYAASKAGMDHFTRGIALELAPKGVRVNVVNPGPVRTDLIDSFNIPPEKKDAIYDGMGQLTPLKKIGEPEEIADLIVFLASDKARSITGSSFISDNGDMLGGSPANRAGVMNKHQQ